jgi:DNA polymerase-3 subunit gamma/tau
MPQKLSGIAARMKNMNPLITEMPAVEVVVPNDIIKDEMEHIKGSILSTLRIYLHNSNISFTLRVAQQQEQTRILTRREQFEEMVRQNPSIEKLRVQFDLELA